MPTRQIWGVLGMALLVGVFTKWENILVQVVQDKEHIGATPSFDVKQW